MLWRWGVARYPQFQRCKTEYQNFVAQKKSLADKNSQSLGMTLIKTFRHRMMRLKFLTCSGAGGCVRYAWGGKR